MGEIQNSGAKFKPETVTVTFESQNYAFWNVLTNLIGYMLKHEQDYLFIYLVL